MIEEVLLEADWVVIPQKALPLLNGATENPPRHEGDPASGP
jgi:hypothetical protein